MKKLFFAALMMLSSGIWAQIELSKDFSYEVSKPYSVVDARQKYYFSQDGEILTVKISGVKTTIQKFKSGSLNFDKVNVSELPKGTSLEWIAQINKRIYVFFSLWDKPSETEQMFMSEIDFKKGSFAGKPTVLFKVKGKIAKPFNINTSHDYSKVVFSYRRKPEVKRDTESYDIIGMYAFNGDMQLEWNQEVKMPYTEAKMDNLDFSIDSKGNGYILAKVYKGDRPKQKDANNNPNYDIEVIRIDAGTADIDQTKIQVKGKFINKIWMYEDAKGYMVCAGYYGNGKSAGADGVFMCKVKNDGEAYDVVSYEIPVSILNEYVSEKGQKKNEKKEAKDEAAFNNLVMRQFVTTADGGIILIGEVYYVVTHTTSKGQTTYTYYYEDMLMTKINSKGELEWMKKLPKKQIGSAGRGGMSFQYIEGANAHYVLFLDNVKNLTLTKDQYPVAHRDGKGGFLTGFKVDDESGDVSRVSILDTRDVKGIEVFQFKVDRIVPLNDKEFAVEVYKKKKEDVMIKVTLND